MECVIVTGGAGFIGATLIKLLIQNTQYFIINIDCLTTSSNISSLQDIDMSRYVLENINICDTKSVIDVLNKYKPVGIFHLAAESHVDTGLLYPEIFIQTNVVGTFSLLTASSEYHKNHQIKFKFIHVSTDEVFGSTETDVFDENSPYRPNSPYSATKASSDFLVRSWCHSYSFPAIITNCTNNYGKWQKEKLIPTVIQSAIHGENILLYGNGQNIRDWIHVEDHAIALMFLFHHGIIGERYCIGANNEKSNIELITTICQILDSIKPQKDFSYKSLISFAKDRAGHDYRYAINPKKINELGWFPIINFETGVYETVKWYFNFFTSCVNTKLL